MPAGLVDHTNPDVLLVRRVLVDLVEQHAQRLQRRVRVVAAVAVLNVESHDLQSSGIGCSWTHERNWSWQANVRAGYLSRPVRMRCSTSHSCSPGANR
jgi:hypothetical protein